MQVKEVKAFRQKMRTRGYTEISIKKIASDLYRITAVEPVAKMHVVVEMSVTELNVCFGRGRRACSAPPTSEEEER